MKKTRLLFLFVPFVLISCAGLQEKPATMENHVYIDSNIPRVEIEFPFDLDLIDKKVDYQEQTRIVNHILRSPDHDVTAYISKQHLLHAKYYFTGTDSSSEKDPFYLSQDPSGYCAVNLYEENLNTFLRGTSYRYISKDVLVAIRIFKHIGRDLTKQEIKDYYKASLDGFTEKIKAVCAQNIRR